MINNADFYKELAEDRLNLIRADVLGRIEDAIERAARQGQKFVRFDISNCAHDSAFYVNDLRQSNFNVIFEIGILVIRWE